MAAILITEAMVTAALEATASKTRPGEANPFRKGDSVVYPAHGVGRIDRVGIEDISGHRLDLIHISFDENRMTLRIPVARAQAAGLRKLASRKQLAEALATLADQPRVSRLVWTKRAQENQAKINSGELRALAEVVRDLQVAGDGSGSNFSRRHLFELALDRLAAEFAAVNRTAKTEAVAQLNQALLESKNPNRPCAYARDAIPPSSDPMDDGEACQTTSLPIEQAE